MEVIYFKPLCSRCCCHDCSFFLKIYIYIIYIYLYLLYLGTLHGHVFRYSEVCTLHNLDDCVFQECVMLLDRYVASSQDGEKTANGSGSTKATMWICQSLNYPFWNQTMQICGFQGFTLSSALFLLVMQ